MRRYQVEQTIRKFKSIVCATAAAKYTAGCQNDIATK